MARAESVRTGMGRAILSGYSPNLTQSEIINNLRKMKSLPSFELLASRVFDYMVKCQLQVLHYFVLYHKSCLLKNKIVTCGIPLPIWSYISELGTFVVL